MGKTELRINGYRGRKPELAPCEGGA